MESTEYLNIISIIITLISIINIKTVHNNTISTNKHMITKGSINGSTINQGVINSGLGVKDTNELISKALDDYTPITLVDEFPDIKDAKEGKIYIYMLREQSINI